MSGMTVVFKLAVVTSKNTKNTKVLSDTLTFPSEAVLSRTILTKLFCEWLGLFVKLVLVTLPGFPRWVLSLAQGRSAIQNIVQDEVSKTLLKSFLLYISSEHVQ